MANDRGEKAIVLVQRWGAGKIPINTEFKLKDSNRILKLIACDGYPYGKMVFDNGEVFDIGKYFDSYFLEVKLEIEEQENNVYDEEFWNELDKVINGSDTGEVRKSFVSPQENRNFHNFAYYDVTEIIDEKLRTKDVATDNKLIGELYKYFNKNNYPFFTKDKLVILFNSCKFEKTRYNSILKVIKNNSIIGYLIMEDNKYMFTPKVKSMDDEYSYKEDNSTGFFYTAESYLDVALSSIENYKREFINLYHNNLGKNKNSFGYQADSTIKTLLAFASECYLKALLIDDGKDLNDIKNIGHGLSVLFTSLNDDDIAYIFSYMERHGYDINKSMYSPSYEANDLTEKFMLDLARVDGAFVDSRYCAENDKNTDYNFLYQFAFALRYCLKKKFMTSSPFDNLIENKVGKLK